MNIHAIWMLYDVSWISGHATKTQKLNPIVRTLVVRLVSIRYSIHEFEMSFEYFNKNSELCNYELFVDLLNAKIF